MTSALGLLTAALADRYRIVREIGAGGMATVYLAEDLKHERNVAIKVLKPELGAVLGVDRFLAEIKVTANLQHPNLLPLFDSGEAAGLLFYVMPYVEGETLRSRIDREKQLPVDEAVRIGAAIAAALDYAHSHGVVHRDLKPENILLQHGQPLIADFGIALAVTNAGGARVTQTGLSLGTPQYMSPEQATGDRVIDGRSDIYSLSAMLYEMLVGDPPHTGSTVQAIVSKVLTEAPPSVRVARPSVPEHVAFAVTRGLEKLAADRWTTAHEFSDALTGRVMMTGAMRAGQGSASSTSTRTLRTWQIATVALTLVTAFALWKALRPVTPEQSLQLARQLTFDGTAVGAALSPDGMWLAYVTEDCYGKDHECGFTLNVREVDGTQSVRLVSWPRIGHNIKWSPNGSLIAFMGRIDSSTSGVYIAPRLGGSTRRLGEVPQAFTFSADGRALVTVTGSPGSARFLRYDVATSARTNGAALPNALSFSDLAASDRNANYLAVIANNTTQLLALISDSGDVLDTIGGLPRDYARWTASGDALLFSYGPGIADNLVRIRVRGDRFVHEEPSVLLGQVPTGYTGIFDAAQTGRVAVVVYPTTHTLDAIRLDVANASWVRVTERTGYIGPAGASPDGRFIAADVTDNLGDNIYVLPIGGVPKAVSSARGTRQYPMWSPDGRRLAYNVAEGDANAGIVIADVAGGAEHVVLREGTQTRFAWRGNDRLLVASNSSIRLLDTAGVVQDSVAVPDSLRLEVSLFQTSVVANTDGSHFVITGANGSVVRLDLAQHRLVVVYRLPPRTTVAGVGDDGSVFLMERGVATNAATIQRDRLLRLAPGSNTPVTVMALPNCRNVIVSAGGKLAQCNRFAARPDVWLADVAGRSGW